MDDVILMNLYYSKTKPLQSIILPDSEKDNINIDKWYIVNSFWVFSPDILPISSSRLKLLKITVQSDSKIIKNVDVIYNPVVSPKKDEMFFVTYNKAIFNAKKLYFVFQQNGSILPTFEKPETIKDIKLVSYVFLKDDLKNPNQYTCLNNMCIPSEIVNDKFIENIYTDPVFSPNDNNLTFRECNMFCGGIKPQLYNILDQVEEEDKIHSNNNINVIILLLLSVLSITLIVIYGKVRINKKQ